MPKNFIFPLIYWHGKSQFCRKNFSSHISIGTKIIALSQKTFPTYQLGRKKSFWSNKLFLFINWQKNNRFVRKNLRQFYVPFHPMSFLYACPGISPQRRHASSSQTSYRSLSVQARKVRSFRCSSSPQKVFDFSGAPEYRGHCTVISPSDGYSVVKEQISPHSLPVGEAIFSGVLKKYFYPFTCSHQERRFVHPFSKNISSYIGLLKNPSEINPLRKLFSSLLYRNFFVSKLNLILKIIFLFTYYANPEVISGGICKNYFAMQLLAENKKSLPSM